MPVRKYEKVIDYIKNKYIDKNPPENGRLPSEPELARELKISRFPVNQAYNILMERGELTKISGLGAFIRGHEPKNYLNSRSARLTAGIVCETGAFFPETLSGLNEALSGTGILLTNLVYDKNYSAESIQARVAELDLSGLFIVPRVFFGHRDEETLKMVNKLAGKGALPIILERPLAGYKGPQILLDNAGGSAMATEWMLHDGRSEIAYIGKDDYIVGKERCHGYLNAINNCGLKVAPGLIHLERGGENFHSSLETFIAQSMDRLLKRHPDCRSFVAFNSLFAYGIYSYMKERGIFGKDVKIAAFDSFPYINEEFTASYILLRRPLHEIGIAAGNFLKNVLAGKRGPSPVRRIPPEMCFHEEFNMAHIKTESVMSL